MDAFPFHIFRKYDIRGVYGTELTPGLIYRVARAFGSMCRERTGKENPMIVIGMDARLSSPQMMDSFAAGLQSLGFSWIDIGLCPTPLTYFAAHTLEVDGFAMVTASHNPPADNGLKLGIGTTAIHSGDMVLLGERAAAEGYAVDPAPAQPAKRIDIVQLYQRYILDAFSPLKDALSSLGRDLKVVVDSGNGTAGVVFPQILRELGIAVCELYSEPDGSFPNHHPDPTLPEALEGLREEILKTGSDLGISFDGDADRIGVLDERGTVIWGDMLLLLLGLDVIARWRSSGMTGDPPLLISEVKASQVLYDTIERAGGRVQMWKTGHSLIKARMKETGAAIAGEMSGHLFFADTYFGFDDALYGAIRILEVYVRSLLEGTCRCFSDLLGEFPETVSTPEIRFPCDESTKFDLVREFAAALEKHMGEGREPEVQKIIDIDGVRASFDSGWGLLRASNTQPVLVMRFEGPDEEVVKGYRDLFNALVEEAEKKVKIER